MIETARLVIRRFVVTDAPFVLELLEDPAFRKHVGDRGVRDLEDARKYIEAGPVASYERHGSGLMLMLLRESSVPVGMCGILHREELPAPDLGYALLPSFRGRGLAKEACDGVLSDARARGVEEVLAIVSKENAPSIAVLEHLGFERRGEHRSDGEALALFAIDLRSPESSSET